MLLAVMARSGKARRLWKRLADRIIDAVHLKLQDGNEQICETAARSGLSAQAWAANGLVVKGVLIGWRRATEGWEERAVIKNRLRKLGGVGVLAVASVASIQAGEREAMAPSLHVRPAAASEVEALENYSLVSLTSAHFASGRADLRHEERAAVDQLAKRLCQTADSVIELRGYADGAVSAAENLKLSDARAVAVAQLLIERGVAPQRILTLALGEVDPTGVPGQAEHQRVDVRVFASPK
jgi:outer membrane protein OmpA-like peptidoglycan-associated protein